jgi:hypothetical protein
MPTTTTTPTTPRRRRPSAARRRTECEVRACRWMRSATRIGVADEARGGRAGGTGAGLGRRSWRLNEAARGSAQRSGPGGDDHPSSLQPGGCESDSETRGRGGASGIDRRNQMTRPWRPAYALPDVLRGRNSCSVPLSPSRARRH